MKIHVLVGNPKAKSRTLALCRALATTIAGEYDDIACFDLAEHTAHIFDWPSDRMARLTERVARSDLLIVGSPTYKATYTGLLKSFLDRYPALGLRNIPAIPVMTGGDKSHAMAPDAHLRTLLIELGAIVPTRAFYFETARMDRMRDIIDQWVQDNLISLKMIRHSASGIRSSEEAV
ncbi:NAD(P)H-dependent oxidoreductase [Nocardia nova]|uniref:NAD(P)H-dependent oxidoreductase n=1 Tax=Nocardia nova TaxID=37330 RepID=UPI0007C82C08|nr:NAD(P)H-dependent oxidoreductase [Nocardia nova]